jgi:hypothetical protein
MIRCFKTFRYISYLCLLSFLHLACGGAPASPTDGGGTSATSASLNLELSSTGVSSTAPVTASATLVDASNNPIANQVVSFSLSNGLALLSPDSGTALTNSNGVATVQVVAGSGTGADTITATYSLGAVTASDAAGFETTAAPGGEGSSEGSVVLALSGTSVSAATSVTATATVLDASNNPVTNQVVSFTLTNDLAVLSPLSGTALTDSLGVATVQLVAGDDTGADTITATSELGVTTVTDSASFSVNSSQSGDVVASIEFVSTEPQLISLQGTGGQETSIVTFLVKGQSGAPIADETVNFSLDSSLGGLTLQSASSVSDQGGLVSTVVQAGSVATSVRVRADVAGTEITTQSAALVVSTGIPDQDSFSLVATVLNVDAYNFDGNTSKLSIRLADQFNNPAPDDTPVTVSTEGGSVTSSCLTVDGVCTVTWTGQNPRADTLGTDIGVTDILAAALGNESFTDANGNGLFDSGEAFTDIGEPYRDDNNNGTYDAGEVFQDADSDSSRDGPDGIYNGVLCGAVAEAAGDCNKSTVTISDSIRLRMSDGDNAPIIVGAPASISAPTVFAVLISDANGNALPLGAEIEVETSSGSIENDPGETVGSTASPTVTTIEYMGGAGDGSVDESGNLQIIVTFPRGQRYAYFIPVSLTATSTTRIGNSTSGVFVQGVLGAGAETLSPSGSTALTVNFIDEANDPVTDSIDVNFSSGCATAGTSTIVPGAVTATTGEATATYTAGAVGCVGGDVLTASAVVDGILLTAATVIDVLDTVSSLQFISADPTVINLQGSGGAESSVVTFLVRGVTGIPVPNQTVDFTLNTSVGGISVGPALGISDSNGLVTTAVQSGRVATSVRVIATVNGTAISTLSDQLSITTGIPDQDSMSLSLSNFNPEAWGFDGVESEVTVRLADIFNNPVPDGTAVQFYTEGGAIDASCTTAAGVCSVNWRSQSPRPLAGAFTSGESRAGRVTILAAVIGNESFFDTNGNGQFDGLTNGEASANFTDLGEAFLDINEDDSYNSDLGGGISEFFIDFNSDFTRNAGDTLYNGILCDSASTALCNVSTISVRDSAVLVMSASGAVITGLPGSTIDVSAGAEVVTLTIADTNGNSMPSGTTINVNTTNGDFIGLEAFTIAAATEPFTFSITVIGDATPSLGGGLEITLESPSGVQTFASQVIQD